MAAIEATRPVLRVQRAVSTQLSPLSIPTLSSIRAISRSFSAQTGLSESRGQR